MVSGPLLEAAGFDDMAGVTVRIVLRHATDYKCVIEPRGDFNHRPKYGLGHGGANPVNR
jgi:hypothetical protein